MASSKAPKHDFAPAWLKIPDQESHRQSLGGKGAEDKNRPGRRDDYYPGYQRFDYPPYPGPIPRQRSFDNYYEGERRYGQQKFRHHSVEDEFYGQQYYPYYQNNYNNFDKFGNHYRSQPQLGKYPNNRYGQMNGGFPPPPPNFDPYYDYYHSNGGVNPHYNNYNSRPNSSKRYNDSRNNKDKDKENNKDMANDNKQKKEEEEFPSLNGDTEEVESKQSVKPSSSVWEKSTVSKLKIMKGSNNNQKTTSPHKNGTVQPNADKPNKLNNPQIYKTLVPKVPAQKGSRSDSVSKPVTNGRIQATTPNDKLNTRLVTTPKNLSDTKSKFLRQLKHNNNGSELTNGQTNGHIENGHGDEKVLENGTDDHIENGSDDICSKMRGFSVEEEQRLLMSWGWRGDDGELTEDEKQELRLLSKQIAQLKQQRNGVHVKPTLRKTPWPPIAPVTVRESDGEITSSSDESDLDS